jgi:2-octaprenyl-6-methoxyphenol hydroxylase
MHGAFDILVAGAGPAGLAAAALSARSGARTVCLTGPDIGPDPRTVAIMQPGLRLLQALELWPGDLQAQSAPLKKLRLIDDTGGILAAPELTFDARETNEDAFGWNVPLKALCPALRAQCEALGVVFLADSATGMEIKGNFACVSRASGEAISARVVFAADGRSSVLRQAAGITAKEWAYDQAAIVTHFAHSADHRGISTEYHTPSGPFTTVPLPGRRSSLVWMERPARAAEIAALSPAELAREIQIASHGELGLITDAAACHVFPMRGLTADIFAKSRVYLMGEAAHVVPPIGAQGLNMSLRDAALAAELAGDALQWGDDPGDEKLLSRYDNARRADVMPRQTIIDLMNRSLLSDLLPLEIARALGIGIAGHVPFIRSRVMQQGLAPQTGLPRLMRA